MTLAPLKKSQNRMSVLRTLGRLFIVVFVCSALAIALYVWQRTLHDTRQQLAHTSQLMTQGARRHLRTFELVLNAMAEELAYRDAFNNPEVGDAFLAHAQQTDMGMVGYGLIDLNGNFVAASTRDLLAPLPNVEQHALTGESFREVVRAQRFDVGQPYFFEAVGEWIIPFRVPVFDTAGEELLGVLTAGSQLDGGVASWARMPTSESYKLGLLRTDGRVAYIRPLPETKEQLQQIFSQPAAPELQDVLNAPGFHRVSGGLQRLGNQNAATPHYLWVEPLPEYDLTVVAGVPRRAVVMLWLEYLQTPFVIWVLFVLVASLGYKNAKRLLAKANHEVTEQREALIRSVAQYHELTRLIPIGVFQFRLSREHGHELTYTSERFREILALDAVLPVSTSLAQHVYQQLHPEDAFSFYQKQSVSTKEGREFYWEGRLKQSQGERWVSVHSVPGEETGGMVQLWNGVVADITERKRAEAQINQLAYYDALTQLPNRRLLRERLQLTVDDAQHQQAFAALMFIDVDNFKQLNDSFGHAEGDRMLAEVGRRLQALVRDYDTVARLGGDEFVVLLTHLATDAGKAATQVETVVHKIERLLNEPFRLGAQQANITLSTGITLIDGSEGDIDMVLQQADQAMYRAKDAGRNTQCFFDANIQQLISEQLELQNELRHAIANEELVLHYQPKFNRDQSIAGVEALIRWPHPRKGMISPASFITIAEQSDDIVRLGDWILGEACRQLVAWKNDPERAQWTISINVSVRQLRANDFAEKVLVTLAESGAPADRLLLEITESMLMVDTEQVIEKMARLKRVGVRFSLDDFGTGYSSLGYLNRLPIDELKIDQSFIRDMDTDEHHQVLIRTIMSLGHTLSLHIVAEGVETEQQFLRLRSLGCDLFQGYYFAKPTLPDAIVAPEPLGA